MLTHDEELWEKELPPAVEELLSSAKDPLADRSDRCESLMCLHSHTCTWQLCTHTNHL